MCFAPAKALDSNCEAKRVIQFPGCSPIDQPAAVVALRPEEVVRQALTTHLLAGSTSRCEAIAEFWVPRSHERADLAIIGRRMDCFEIKTEGDTLRRLPRQIEAYARLFDRCTAVIAEKHSERVADLLPSWWGITTVHVNGSVTFTNERAGSTNREVDPEMIVRLLWRDEAFEALQSLGSDPDPSASRNALWHALLHTATLDELRRLVRRALVERDPARARIATRRFTSTNAVPVTGR